MMQQAFNPNYSDKMVEDADDLLKVYYQFYHKMKQERDGQTMPFVPMRIKLLELEGFSIGVLRESENPSYLIAAYLHRIINEQKPKNRGCCFIIPSLLELSEFFGIVQTEIRRAFWRLRMQGYDFAIPNNMEHIALWSN